MKFGTAQDLIMGKDVSVRGCARFDKLKGSKAALMESNEATKTMLIVRQEHATPNGVRHDFLYFSNYATFIKALASIPEAQRNFHEVICTPGTKQKIRFDIDVDLKATGRTVSDYEAPYKIIVDTIKEVLGEWELFENMVILEFCSSDASKFSRHIVINGVHAINNSAAKAVAMRVEEALPAHVRGMIDLEVYKSVQGFRMYKSCKAGTSRVKKYIGDATPEFEDTLLTVIPASSVEFDPVTLDYERISEIYKGLTSKVIVTPAQADAAAPASPDAVAPVQNGVLAYALTCAKEHLGSAHTYDPHTSNATLLKFIRNASSDCAVCNRRHEKDNTAFVTISYTGKIHARCFKNKGASVVIGDYSTLPGVDATSTRDAVAKSKDERAKQMKAEREAAKASGNEDFYILKLRAAEARKRAGIEDPIIKSPDFASVKVVNAPEVSGFEFPDGANTLAVRALMGLGKTKQLYNYIAAATRADPKMRVVIVSFRMSFTDKIISDLPQFADYRWYDDGKLREDLDSAAEEKLEKRFAELTATAKTDEEYAAAFKSINKIDSQKYIVIQYESIRSIATWGKYKYLMVLDESESILSQMDNPVLAKMGVRNKTWAVFESLLTRADRVIAMDAFMSDRTVSLLKNAGRRTHLCYNKHHQSGKVDRYYASKDALLDAIKAHAKHASEAPFVVCTNSCAMSETIAVLCIKNGVPSEKIGVYNSDMSDERRAELRDVHTHWSKYDIVIYTSTISAGCSYELERFTCVYGYFTNKSSDYLTAIQMLGRVRNIKPYGNHSAQYHLYVATGVNDSPSSIEDIEAAVSGSVGAVYDIACQTAGFLDASGTNVVVDTDGNYKILHKNAYYHAAIRNLQLRIRSRNKFIVEFMELRLRSGHSIQLDDKLVREDKEIKVIKDVLKTVKIKTTAAAEVVENDGHAVALIKDDKVAEKKAMICNVYGVAPHVVDADFLDKYGGDKIMSRYRRLNMLYAGNRSADENLAQIAETRRIEMATDDTAVFDRSNFDFARCCVGRDIANILTGGEYGKSIITRGTSTKREWHAIEVTPEILQKYGKLELDPYGYLGDSNYYMCDGVLYDRGAGVNSLEFTKVDITPEIIREYGKPKLDTADRFLDEEKRYRMLGGELYERRDVEVEADVFTSKIDIKEKPELLAEAMSYIRARVNLISRWFDRKKNRNYAFDAEDGRTMIKVLNGFMESSICMSLRAYDAEAGIYILKHTIKDFEYDYGLMKFIPDGKYERMTGKSELKYDVPDDEKDDEKKDSASDDKKADEKDDDKDVVIPPKPVAVRKVRAAAKDDDKKDDTFDV